MDEAPAGYELEEGDMPADDPALVGCPDPKAAQELCSLMSEISEEQYAAGWLSGLEFSLFSAAFEGTTFGYGISVKEWGKLIELSHRCDGWWVWDNERKPYGGRKFMRLNEWLEIYKAGPKRR